MAIKGYLIFTITVVGTLAVLVALSTDNWSVALGCVVAAGLSFFAGIRVGDLPDPEESWRTSCSQCPWEGYYRNRVDAEEGENKHRLIDAWHHVRVWREF